jgi:GTP-binding protein
MNNPNKNMPLVALLGRTNVGKSTLFNCLTEKQQALISDIAGTTRDSNYGKISWNNHEFQLVDTAGIIDAKHLSKTPDKKSRDIDSLAQRQARLTIDNADLILFVLDNRTGLLTEDLQLADALKKNPALSKKTILVANKVDSQKYASEAATFNKLGLGEPISVSSVTGSGTGDLLDALITRLKPLFTEENTEEIFYNKKERGYEVEGAEEEKEERKYGRNKDEINVCIIGKPNVGKSSLLNSILGYERVIVSDEPHTTREPQDTLVEWKDKKIRFVDTAGISKHGHKGDGLETIGIGKSLHALDRADVVLMVVDISEPLTHQDAKIVGEAIERHKSMIIIANKWDKIEEKNTKKWTEEVYHEFPFALWAPIQFISAKTGMKVNKIMDLVTSLAEARKIEISDSQLQKFLSKIVKIHLPAKGKGLKAPRIYEFTQVRSNPPMFNIRIGSKDNLHFSYVRFMENRLREKYGFTGTPVKMTVVKNRKVHGTAS